MISFIFSCKQEGPPFTFTETGESMGTTWSVRIDTDEPLVNEVKKNLKTKIEKETDRVYRLWSTYEPESEISRFNAWKSLQPFPVNPETHKMISEAIRLHSLTGGAFDITIENLTELWGFKNDSGERIPPAENQIRDALRNTGIRQLSVSRPGEACHPCIRKLNPELKIVLNGLHQGYAADRIFQLITNEGYRSVIAEVGGEMRVGALRPVIEEKWNIGMERPDFEGRRILTHTISVSDTSVSTSGDYRSWFSHNGVRYGHIIDPRTGYPSRSGNAAVTVIGPEAWMSDALATAAFLLPPEEIRNMLKKFPDYGIILTVYDPKKNEFRQLNFSKLEPIPLSE